MSHNLGKSIINSSQMIKQTTPTYMLNHIGNKSETDDSKKYADDQKDIIDANVEKMYYRKQHDIGYDINYEDSSKNYNVIQNNHPLGISMVTNHGEKGYDYRDFPKSVLKDVEESDPYITYLHNSGLIGKTKSRYVTYYLNVDSSVRNQQQAVTLSKTIELFPDPLLFSDIYLRIYVPDISLFQPNDKITIGNLPNKTTILRTFTLDDFGHQVDSFIFTDGLPYMQVLTYNNTDINPPIFEDALAEYDYSDIQVGFSGFIGDTLNKYTFNAIGFTFSRASNGNIWIITITENVFAVSAPFFFEQDMVIGQFETDLVGNVITDLTVQAIGPQPNNFNNNDNSSLLWADSSPPFPPLTTFQGVPPAYFTAITSALSVLPPPSIPTDFFTYMKYVQDVQNITRPIFLSFMNTVPNFGFQYAINGATYSTSVSFINTLNPSINMSTQLTSFIGNAPVNLLNNYNTMYYTGDEIIRLTDPTFPMTQIPSSDTFYTNLFAIYQTTQYIWDTSLLPNTLVVSVYTHAKATDITITFYQYGGVPTRFINSQYPIGFTSNQGYQSIVSVVPTPTSMRDPDNPVIQPKSGYITIKMNRIGFYNNRFGGDIMFIGLVNELIAGYPKPESYVLDLQKVYTNVVLVKMISSVFTPTDTVFSDGVRGNKKNNAFYWQNLYDGEHIYQINISSGTYTADQLVTEIETRVSQLLRYDGNVVTAIPNVIKVTIDTSTNAVTFSNFTSYQSPIEPFVATFKFSDINDPTNIASTVQENQYYIYPNGYFVDYPNAFISFQSTYRVKVEHVNHMLNAGDTILIEGAINDGVISPDYLNGTHTVIRIIDSNSYDIVIDQVNPIVPANPDQMGGFDVTILTANSFRIRFDFPDTFGTELGFRNVGDPTSITPYQPVITNNVVYEQEDLQLIIEQLQQTTVNVSESIGNTIPDIRNALELTGPPYFIITCDELPNVKGLGLFKNFFYKINLDGNGDFIFDTFVDSPIFYNEPIQKLSQLTLNFFNPTGQLYDFNGRDHSFVLEIVTFDETPIETSVLRK